MFNSETVPVDYLGGKPLCMNQYSQLLSSCRIPGLEMDSVVFHGKTSYPSRYITLAYNSQVRSTSSHTCLTFWDCIHPFTKNGVIMHLSRKSEVEDQIIKQLKRCRMHSFHCANCNCIFHNPQIILLQYCWDSALNINGNMYITGTRDKDFQELCQFIYIINHFMGGVNSGAFHSWLWVCGRNINPQCAAVFTFAQKLPQAPGKGIILWTSGDFFFFVFTTVLIAQN